MTIHFHIAYRTVVGEEVSLNTIEGHEVKTHRMTTADGNDWFCDLTGKKAGTMLTYYYKVVGNGHEREEWQTVRHVLELTCTEAVEYTVYDRWNTMPEDSYLYSSAFTDCINHQQPQPMKPSGYAETVRLVVRAPQLRDGERLALVGAHPSLGAWNPCKALSMTLHAYGEWTIDLDAALLQGDNVELKFVCTDASGHLRMWECGFNRNVSLPAMRKGQVVVCQLDQAFFEICNRKLAGTLVPVFSLRSEGSAGVGDFGDLRRMIDLVAGTGQRVLQLLPVNDTTVSHAWTDSYPYSCISVFALHPQYADLRALPPLGDETARKQAEVERQRLNALPQLDYEQVNRFKLEYLQQLYLQEGRRMMATTAFKDFFREAQEWLVPYAQYSWLREQHGTADFSQWEGHTTWNEADRKALSNPRSKAWKEVAFYYFVQFILSTQMKQAHDHARRCGVILKGDIPIGVNRLSCDVWMEPRYFNLDEQTGAPPDDFSEDGQNWGFPTYNWDEMLKDGCQWWVRRFQNMAQFFDAYRIDHVLGFFRIWAIPIQSGHGLLGQFSPALAMSREEIERYGLHFQENRFTASDTTDVLFVRDHRRPELFHPRIAAQRSTVYASLSDQDKDAFNRLYDDYYYRRNNQFWYHEAMKKLPRLVQATRMLVCAEDLGMVPECVPWVMDELKMLSLELQSMPKAFGVRFGHLSSYPYRSVCTISSHDTPTLRQWWDEDIERTQDYYRTMLYREGDAPHPLPGWLAKDIIARHLASPSMLCILSIQDWLAIDERLRLPDANGERINIPANPRHYWRYRMHCNIEDLMADETWTSAVATLVRQGGRE